MASQLAEPKAQKQKSHPQGGFKNLGGPTGTRTQDQVIKSHLLYQLSYRSKGIVYPNPRKVSSQ